MVRHLLQLNADERRSAARLFAYGFGNAAAYVIARTVADSLFLGRIGPEQLPKVYLAAAGVVALVSACYGKAVATTTVQRTILVTLLLLAGASVAIPFVVHLTPTSAFPLAIAYLLAQLRGSLGTIQYTMMLNEQFAHRQPERIVGVVGLGATLAGFFVGLALGADARVDDLVSLMFLVGGIDLATMIPILLLPKVARPKGRLAYEPASESPRPSRRGSSTGRTHHSSYMLTIASVVAMGVIVSTIVEFQWKSTVALEFQRNENELAKYFGFFYGSVYLIAGTLQLFVTGSLLQRRGLLVGLLLFPGVLLAACLTTFLASAERLVLWGVTLTKGCDSLKRSMNDPSIQVSYRPLQGRHRHRAITFVSGITKPLAEAAAALSLLAIMPFLSVQYLTVPVIVLIAVWIGLNFRVWRAFVRMSISPDSDSLRTAARHAVGKAK
jgi:ATP/ADP translocase